MTFPADAMLCNGIARDYIDGPLYVVAKQIFISGGTATFSLKYGRTMDAVKRVPSALGSPLAFAVDGGPIIAPYGPTIGTENEKLFTLQNLKPGSHRIEIGFLRKGEIKYWEAYCIDIAR